MLGLGRSMESTFQTDLRRFVQRKKAPWRGRHDLGPTADIISATPKGGRHELRAESEVAETWAATAKVGLGGVAEMNWSKLARPCLPPFGVADTMSAAGHKSCLPPQGESLSDLRSRLAFSLVGQGIFKPFQKRFSIISSFLPQYGKRRTQRKPAGGSPLEKLRVLAEQKKR